MLHYVPCHKELWSSGTMPARSQEVNLSAVWWWIIGFTTRPLYPRGKCVQYVKDTKPNGLQSWSGRLSQQKNNLHLPTTKPKFLGHQARSPFTIPIKNSGSLTLRLINLPLHLFNDFFQLPHWIWNNAIGVFLNVVLLQWFRLWYKGRNV